MWCLCLLLLLFESGFPFRWYPTLPQSDVQRSRNQSVFDDETKRMFSRNVPDEKLTSSNYTVDILVREIESCEVESLVIFVENNNNANSVTDLLFAMVSSASCKFIIYDISGADDTHIKQLLRKNYINLGVKDFRLVSNRVDVILSLAEDVFSEGKHGNTAFMPHGTKWTVITWSDVQLDRILTTLQSSSFDNVAIWHFLSDGDLAFDLPKVHTLRWGTNRRRYIDVVPLEDVGQQCHTFPNVRYDFNGRNLHAVTKFDSMYSGFVRFKKDTHGTKPEYAGVYIEIFDMLAKALNFSYTIEVTNVSWAEYAREMGRLEGDVGLSFWPSIGQYVSMETTSPVFLNSVRGFYLELDDNQQQYWPMMIDVMCPFPPVILLYLLAALTFSVCFYTVIKVLNVEELSSAKVTRPFSSDAVFRTAQNDSNIRDTRMKKADDETTGDNVWDHSKYDFQSNKLDRTYPDVKPADGRVCLAGTIRHDQNGSNFVRKNYKSSSKQHGKCWHILQLFHVELSSTFWSFMPSIFNQGYLPNPAGMAARGYVWTWALFTVCFSAVFTSYLTSYRVAPTENFGVQTFEGLVKGGPNRWFVLLSSSVAGILSNSNMSLFQKLSRDAINFKHEDEKDVPLEIVSLMKTKLVFIHYELTLNILDGLVSEPYRLKMMDEELIQAHAGFALPKHSELNEVLYKEILCLHDAGIIVRIMRNNGYLVDIDERDLNGHDDSKAEGHSMHMYDLMIALVAISCCLGASIVLLVGECVVHRVRITGKGVTDILRGHQLDLVKKKNNTQ